MIHADGSIPNGFSTDGGVHRSQYIHVWNYIVYINTLKMVVKLYTTSVTTNREIFNKQNRIKHVFEAKGIPFEEIDLCQNQEARDQMREKAGIPDLLPPAIFNDDNYCGDFQQFEDSVEDNKLKEFLKLQ